MLNHHFWARKDWLFDLGVTHYAYAWCTKVLPTNPAFAVSTLVPNPTFLSITSLTAHDSTILFVSLSIPYVAKYSKHYARSHSGGAVVGARSQGAWALAPASRWIVKCAHRFAFLYVYSPTLSGAYSLGVGGHQSCMQFERPFLEPSTSGWSSMQCIWPTATESPRWSH